MNKTRRDLIRDAGIVSVILGGLATLLPRGVKAAGPASAPLYAIQFRARGSNDEWRTGIVIHKSLADAENWLSPTSWILLEPRIVKLQIAGVAKEYA
jgi:hypothetical protein